MIKIFLFFILLCCMLGIGSLLVDERGYVLIQVAGWTWEASFIGFLFILLVFYVIYKVCAALLLSVWTARRNLSNWRSHKKQKASLVSLENAIEALVKGHWQQAEKYSLRLVKNSPIAKSHYLIAAEAARKLGNIEEANMYTLRAEENSSEQAKQQALVNILVQEGKLEKAQEICEQLYQSNKKEPANLVLLARIYQQKQANEKLRDLLPQVKKYTDMSQSELVQLALGAWQPLFHYHAKAGEYKSIKSEYKAISKLLQDHQPATEMYLSALLEAQQGKLVNKHIKRLLLSAEDKNQDTIWLLSSLALTDTQELMEWTRKQLQKDPKDPWLNSALAIFASKSADWTLAEKAMAECIETLPSMENFALLGDIQSHTGDLEKSRESYRLALEAKEDKKLIELK